MVNGDVESWHNMFPRLAHRFGLRVKPDQLRGPAGDEGSTADLADRPPVGAVAAQAGLVGAVTPSKLEQRIDLVK